MDVLHGEPEYRRRRREEAEQNQHYADREWDEATQQRNTVEIIAVIKSVEEKLSLAIDEDAPKNKSDRRRHWAEILALLAAAAVGLVAIIVGNQDAAQQRRVMQGQLDEMRAEQRPWVSIVAIRVTSPLIINEHGGHLSVNFVMKNVGHTPAAHVAPIARMFTRSFDAHEMSLVNSNCAKARNPNSTTPAGITVFPGQISELAYNFVISPADLDRLRHESDSSTTVMIAGCIDYVFEFTPDHHQTGFVYEVDKAGAGDALFRLNPDEKSVGASDLRLMINPRLEGNAD